MNVKLMLLTAVPSEVTTPIGPLVAPSGTVAVICVSESIEKPEALVPLNCTSEAFVKSEPVMIMGVPAAPLAGEKLEIVGAVRRAKGAARKGFAPVEAAPASTMT